jgi:hypothetical protein
MIKLYSWVDIFLNFINEKRKEELKIRFKVILNLLLTLASLNFFPLLLQSVSFSVFIGSGFDLDLAVAYTVITIF